MRTVLLCLCVAFVFALPPDINQKKNLDLNLDGQVAAVLKNVRVDHTITLRPDLKDDCNKGDACGFKTDQITPDTTVNAYEFTYADGLKIQFCLCSKGPSTANFTASEFAKVPLVMRSAVKKISSRSSPAFGGGLCLGPQVMYFGNPSTAVMVHESAHSHDAANSINGRWLSSTAPYQKAIEDGSCVPSTYGKTNDAEFFACMITLWSAWVYSGNVPDYQCMNPLLQYTKEYFPFTSANMFDAKVARTISLKNGKAIGSSDGQKLSTNANARKFKFVPSFSNNYWIIVDESSFQVVDPTGQNPVLAERKANMYQQWGVQSAGQGTYKIFSRVTGLALDGCGASLSMKKSDNSTCQSWTISGRVGPVPKYPDPVKTPTTLPKLVSGGQSDTLTSDGPVLVSPNGQYRFVCQVDGNLVVYNKANQVIWATQRFGNGPTRLTQQDDGNLVEYDVSGQVIWTSNTWRQGQAPFTLSLSDTGKLSLTDGTGRKTWGN